jgi:hypothetical protein
MLLILLEALGAGCILVLIVWWTMFSGRADAEAAHQAANQQAPDLGKTAEGDPKN